MFGSIDRAVPPRLGAIIAAALMLTACGGTRQGGRHEGRHEERAVTAPATGDGCTAGTARYVPAGLSVLSAQHVWALENGRVLETTDGGRHWQLRYRTPSAALTDVDFVDPADGWVAGPRALARTRDGGRTWTRLPLPCGGIHTVQFRSPRTGWAITARGAGRLLATRDGGQIWTRAAAPAAAQSICFQTATTGWLGADGQVYRTVDGGRTWERSLSYPSQPNIPDPTGSAQVECTRGSAWAVLDGTGSGMSQQPHVAYRFDGHAWRVLYSEGYYPTSLPAQTPAAPGGYSGPFSPISSAAAVFIDECEPCHGAGTAPFDVVTDGGRRTAAHRTIAGLNLADSVSFQSPARGWVIGNTMIYGRRYRLLATRTQILGTTDGGLRWHTEFTTTQ